MVFNIYALVILNIPYPSPPSGACPPRFAPRPRPAPSLRSGPGASLGGQDPLRPKGRRGERLRL